MGGAEHEGEWERSKAQWSYDAGQNIFPLPHEVFELGLEQGALLVYIYLVYHKSRKHRTSELGCATISSEVGLCEKTVRRHLHTLISKGLVQIAGRDSSFSYTLCPIRDKVQEQSSGDAKEAS